MAVFRQYARSMATKTSGESPQAVAMARSLLRARERGAIRTAAARSWLYVPQPDGLARHSRAMRHNSAWRRNSSGDHAIQGTVDRIRVAGASVRAAVPRRFRSDRGTIRSHRDQGQEVHSISLPCRVLGVLSKHGTVLYHLGPATGRWKYNSMISWWAVPPEPDWESARLSWSDSGHDMSYVPGETETSS